MASIVNYALASRDAFGERPLRRVDSLCLSWLSYLRLLEEPQTSTLEGLTLAELGASPARSRMAAAMHDLQNTSMLMQALGLSPRFAQVRACMHEVDVSEEEGRQFSATTFVLPDSLGAYVAFRGTDDSILGWQENLRLACGSPVPAQLAAQRYLERVAGQVTGPLWVGGHSKGGTLASYACGAASDEVRERIVCCFSHDGPAVNVRVRSGIAWHDDVREDKTVPSASLVGMLFECSQAGLTAVRSTGEGVRQHGPFTWEVASSDFVCERGLSYDVWKLAQRVGDWLDELGDERQDEVIELLCWLMETTGETTLSGMLARWQANARAMRAALEAGPSGDRELFAQAMDELVTDLVLGSATEHGLGVDDSPQGTLDAAARRLEDVTARTNDRLARLDRLAGL